MHEMNFPKKIEMFGILKPVFDIGEHIWHGINESVIWLLDVVCIRFENASMHYARIVSGVC